MQQPRLALQQKLEFADKQVNNRLIEAGELHRLKKQANEKNQLGSWKKW